MGTRAKIKHFLKPYIKYKKTFLNILLVFAIVVMVQYGVNHFLATERGERFFQNNFTLASTFIILYLSISHVLAPLFAAPISYASLSIFGIWQTSLYTYIAGLISAAVGFWIARRFGRKIVVDLIGEDSMQNVDEFVEHAGEGVLIVSRILGFSLFEVITYAYGLTSISFKKFYLITIIFSIVPNILIPILFQAFDFHSVKSLLVFMVFLGIIGGGYLYVLKHRWRKAKRKIQEKKLLSEKSS